MKLRKAIFCTIATIMIIIFLTGCVFWADQPNVGSSGNKLQEALTPKLPNPDDLYYYDSLDEAVAHNTLNEMSNVTRIDERIKLFENDQYAVLFFKFKFNNNDVLYAFKFYVRKIDGKPHYSPPIIGSGISWETQKYSVHQMKLDAVGEVRLSISRDSFRFYRIDDTKNFFWGISSSPKAKNLKIEGQSATEVIPIKMDGDTAYFWYFDDLKTDKKPVFQDIQKYVKGDFVITMD